MDVYFCKLLPPRPSFALDMTEQEQRLMHEHAAYWKHAIDSGQAVAFGFVGDPAGAFGIGILRVHDEAAARGFTGSDPVIRAACGFEYRIAPMPLGITVG